MKTLTQEILHRDLAQILVYLVKGLLVLQFYRFIDEILRKYSKLAKSFVKDTSHFLHLTKDLQVEESELLVTVDVTALYTNIPHKD